MKKLILLIFLLIAGSTQAQNFDPFVQADTIVRTVQTYYADTIDLGPGNKSIEVQNLSTGVGQVAFNKGTSTTDKKDSVNFTTLQAGNKVFMSPVASRYMYLKSSVAGTFKVIVRYGIVDVHYDYVDGSGNVKVTGTVTATPSGTQNTMPLADTSFIWATDTCVGVADTVSKYSWNTIATLTAKFPTRMRLDITCDSIIQVSTDPTFPAGKTFRILSGESFGFENFYGMADLYIRGYSPAGNPVGIRRWRISLKGR